MSSYLDGAGRVDQYSGTSTVVSASASGSATWFGVELAFLGDGNTDGFSEVLIGEPGGVHVLRANSLFQLSTISGGSDAGNWRQVGGGLDATGDGVPDFASFDPAGGGSVSLHSLPCGGTFLPTCDGAPNSAGTALGFSGVGTLTPSGTFNVWLANGPPNQPGILFYGTEPNDLPYGDGVLCVGGNIQRVNPPIFLSALGNHFTTVLDWSEAPFGSGPTSITPLVPVYFQFWYRDPAAGGAGFNFSNAREVVLCP